VGGEGERAVKGMLPSEGCCRRAGLLSHWGPLLPGVAQAPPRGQGNWVIKGKTEGTWDGGEQDGEKADTRICVWMHSNI
jgi:hypothetical protein